MRNHILLAPSATLCRFFTTRKKEHIEKFYIYKKKATGKFLNNDHMIFPNKIFDSLVKNQINHTPHTP